MENIFGNVGQDMDALLWDSIEDIDEGRKNLGEQMPVAVYRMFEYAMRDTLISMYDKEKMIEIFRAAGNKTGREFCNRFLNISLPLSDFLAQLQQKLIDYKIGVLRIEKFDEETGHAVLTVSEDLDCSGLPALGETVCNYDEGFLGGILETYTQKDYVVLEVDCWATGDRVCRFDARISSDK